MLASPPKKGKGKAAGAPRQGDSEAARRVDALESGDYGGAGLGEEEEDLGEEEEVHAVPSRGRERGLLSTDVCVHIYVAPASALPSQMSISEAKGAAV